jgi:hypothetical protein
LFEADDAPRADDVGDDVDANALGCRRLVGNRNANLRRVAIVDILATTALLTAALIDHTT